MHVCLDNGVWIPRPAGAPRFRLSSHVHNSQFSTDHFFVPIVLEFPNRKPIHTHALVDSGATASCVSLAFANRHSLPRRLKDESIPITAVDGRPIATGLVTHDVVTSLRLQAHSEVISLGVVSVRYPVILGLDWLQRHNPSVDWARRQLALTCCGVNPIHPVSVLGTGLGHVPPPTFVSSFHALSTTSIGLGFGLNSRTLTKSQPDNITRSDQVLCWPHARGTYLSASTIPWHAPRLSSPASRIATTTFRPSSPPESGLGSGLNSSPPPMSSSAPGLGPGLNSVESSSPPSSPSLDISFINSARFRKYARNNPSALLWYHPHGTPGYIIAAASLADTSSPPSTSPLPEPPPAENYLKFVPDKYHDYASVFSPVDVENLPPHRPEFDAAIELEEGKIPLFGPLYHLSQHERQVLFDYVETNLRKGFIRRSTSSAGSPVLFVCKKTGELRLCVDYRGLNAITKKNRYPLPLFDDLLDRVQGCKVFSVLDLKNAFNLIRVRDGDEWKTAFRTHLGLFEYTVMPFGLTNAPGIFQGFIQDTLRNLLDVVCVVYIDDILIFSRTPEEHEHHVKLVLNRLHEAGLFANAKKCAFEQSEVEYLGYLLSSDGIKMHPRKLETIADWPTPASVKDVQSFLGFTNFYRRFIDGYAHIVVPLNALTKKDVRAAPFTLTPAAADAFSMLKHVFMSQPVLSHFDPNLPCTLATDTSDFAIAGVLHQPDSDGLLHPVAFFSRKLSPAEINYEVYNKELLAIVESFRDMRAWLIGTDPPVSVVSDHKNLEYFMSSRVLNRRQARWSMFLSEFNFVLNYAPGLKNPADAPSRCSDFAPQEGDDVLHANEKVLLTPFHTQKLFPSGSQSSAHQPLHISTITSTAIDTSKLWHRYDAAVRDDKEWRDALTRQDPKFKLDGNLVFYDGRLFIPRSMRADILHSRHDSPLAGHRGRQATLHNVLCDYSWPGITTYVRKYVHACDVCGRIKMPRHKPFGLLRPLDIPNRPWQSMTMDYIVKLPLSHGYDSIWVVCDRFTRYAHFVPCNETLDAPGLAWLFLDRIFRYHGLPDSIISDRGSTFVAQFWCELTKLLQVQLKHSTAYHPQTDGLTERTNQTLEAYLRAYVSYQQDNWVDYLPLAEFAFNNSVNASTKQTPFFANYGFHPSFEPRLSEPSSVPAAADLAHRLDRLHDELRDELKLAQEHQARYYNEHVREARWYQPDQLVWLLRRHVKTTRPSDKLDHRRLGPFPIDHAISDVAYKLHLPAHLSCLHPVFHVSLLEPYHDPSDFHAHAMPLPYELFDDTPPHAIHSILDSRRLGQRYEYLVHYKDSTAEEDCWIPLSELSTSYNELLECYHRRNPHTPCPSSILHHNARTTDSSAPLRPQVPPSSAAAPPPPAPAIPHSAPRPSSPAPAHLNPHVEYTPPSQTTLRSGRVSRPPPRRDA